MSAIFEPVHDGAGRYRFHLMSVAAEIVVLSDTYQTPSMAEDAITSVRHSAATAFVDAKTPSATLAPSRGNGD